MTRKAFLAISVLAASFASSAFAQGTPGINPLVKGGVVSLTYPAISPQPTGTLVPLTDGLQIQQNSRAYDLGAIGASGAKIDFCRDRVLEYSNPPAAGLPCNWEINALDVAAGEAVRTIGFSAIGWNRIRINGVVRRVFFVTVGEAFQTGPSPIGPTTPVENPGFTIGNPAQLYPGVTINISFSLNQTGTPFLVFGTYPNVALSIQLAPGQTQVQLPFNLPVGATQAWIEIRNGNTVLIRSIPQSVTVLPAFSLVGPGDIATNGNLLFSVLFPGFPGGAITELRFEELRIGGGPVTRFTIAPEVRTFAIPSSLPGGRYRVNYVITLPGGFQLVSMPFEITILGSGTNSNSCRFVTKLTGSNFEVEVGKGGDLQTIPSDASFSPSFFNLSGDRIPDSIMKTIYLELSTEDSPSLGYLTNRVGSGLNFMAAFAEVQGCGEIGQGAFFRAAPSSTYSVPPTDGLRFVVRQINNVAPVAGNSARFGLFIGDMRMTGTQSVFAYKLGSRNITYLARDGEDFVLPYQSGVYLVFAWNVNGRWSSALVKEVREQ